MVDVYDTIRGVVAKHNDRGSAIKELDGQFPTLALEWPVSKEEARFLDYSDPDDNLLSFKYCLAKDEKTWVGIHFFDDQF